MAKDYRSDDDRRRRHHHRHHRDSDSYYGHSNRGYSPRRDYSDRRDRIPGLVNDPNSNYRGSRDRSYDRRDKKHETSTLNTVSTRPYKNNTAVIDTEPRRGIFMAPTTYDYKKHFVIVPNLLGAIPVVCGCGLLIAAVILPTWLQQFVSSGGSSSQLTSIGLFSVCFYQSSATTQNPCQTREEYANAGLPIDSLEQATRGLVIIAIIVSFVGFLGSIYLGIERFRLHFGSLITGCIHLLAALCAIAGMACYSAFLSNQISSATTGGNTITQAGLAFYLGWFGAALFVVSCATSFITYAMPP